MHPWLVQPCQAPAHCRPERQASICCFLQACTLNCTEHLSAPLNAGADCKALTQNCNAAGSKIDPRAALTGRPLAEGWQSGLMDRGSWVEMQRDWARTVIVGRARLGGCPVGPLTLPQCTSAIVYSPNPAHQINTIFHEQFRAAHAGSPALCANSTDLL